MRTINEARNAFLPTMNLTKEQADAITVIQAGFLETVDKIFAFVPECADRTAATRKLLDAKMTCIQAITHPPAPRA